MEEYIVKIISIEPVTHNVLRIRVEKPEGYSFVPGQATEVCINKDNFKEERRPFTFTSLNDSKYLEFTIKTYTDHDGVTNELRKLKPGDELILHDVWGAISYKGEGIFIAGGAGITPFIAIIRQLYKDGNIGNNKLFFSNKTSKDIILKDSFEKMLGNQFINTLTEEKTGSYLNKRIDKDFLQKNIKDFSQNFYICGPDAMVQAVQQALQELGATEKVITVEV
ncbi:FAD-binding oxidoreductase [Arachidicoccus sp.]|uniref:FAD-binding oxidoreductase n=1 Tax=Arachidicoccus sp. TaxID=1872624 RepID=UPI003D19C183